MSDYILTSSGELYHAGVKGMKWGVRKADRIAAKAARYRRKGDKYRGKAYGTGNVLDGTYKPPRNTSERAFTKNIQKSDAYYSKAAKVTKKGEQYAQKISGKKVAAIVSSTAAVASGALWAASVLVPGAAAEITLARAVLSAGGAAVNLAGSLEAPKSTSRK